MIRIHSRPSNNHNTGGIALESACRPLRTSRARPNSVVGRKTWRSIGFEFVELDIVVLQSASAARPSCKNEPRDGGGKFRLEISRYY